ncbi:caspase family protein [Mesorhizobium sp. ASY16-5R]|uniref:caspase family protein n=1 Tax=Mesorhizobium sp. ASY16-5R TaxID=3445772 RepID=UPI003F9FBE2C
MTGWMRKRALLAASAMAFCLAAISAAPAMARTNYAVLVAVTAYPNLPPKVALVGPNHDAVLVRDYLETRAPVAFDAKNVSLLADGVDRATASPTHANILAALKSVADKAERDDFVYIHLSGHGAQQPEIKAGSESDRLDEIFLPSDTGKWVDQSKGVPNALMDDDIGAALDAIRDKGAFVWFIIDACHSGTATRAAPVSADLETERKVEFEDLGIPASAMVGTQASDDSTREAALGVMDAAASDGDASRAVDLAGQEPTSAKPIGKSGLVAFFAAQTIETTPEMPLPKGSADAQKYGLFTYTIFSKLAENPNITYRQLGHAVLQQYSADSRQRPTPLFEGDLDARVFGSEKIDTVMQWPLEVKDGAATVPAGMLHRLSKGTRLAILPSPTSELSETLGYLEVQSAKNLTSRVTPVAYDGKPALKLDQMPANTYARLAEVVVDFKLKVARPAEADGNAEDVALANAVLDEIAAGADRKFNIELVAPGAEADLRLAVLREDKVKGAAPDAAKTPALWFLPPSGELSLEGGQKPPLVAIDNNDRAKLAKGVGDNLTKIFRATSLSRLAAASDYPADQVNVAFKIRHAKTDTFEPLDGSKVPAVNPGDEVHIEAENLSTKLVDINILYVGSDYSISHMGAQRLVSGAKVDEGLLAFTDTSFGMERMIAVLTEAPPMSEVEDLSFLQQGGVPNATREIGAGGSFRDMLTDIGVAPSTRSAMKLGDKGGQKGAVMIFPLETMPAK